LLLIALPAFGQTLSDRLEKKRYYYSALNEFFKETYSKPITVKHVERLEKLLYYTGIELLEDYDADLLIKYPSSSTRFILGRRAMQRKDFKTALENFNMVHVNHRYYPEALLLSAQVYGQN